MREEMVTGKRMLIIGLARSGAAAVKLALLKGWQVTLCDAKPESAFEGSPLLEELKAMPVRLLFAQDGTEALAEADTLLISPGVPIDAPVVKKAHALQIPVTGELEFAAVHSPYPYLAVTGTNGKTTTVTLLENMIRAAGYQGCAAGNIGYPMSDAVMQSFSPGMLAVEVSSFQLETTSRFHPRAAAVLNVTEDHMNRHGTMAVYTALKAHIFDAMDEGDTAVLNYEDEACRLMADGLKPRVIWFSSRHELSQGVCLNEDDWIVYRDGEEQIRLIPRTGLKIPGMHNVENAMAAAAVALGAGLKPDAVRTVLETFEGVEHRIEKVTTIRGITYYNDSKGTNVDSTLKAIEAMTAPTVLILGGYDKHVSFSALAQGIRDNQYIRACVLIGDTADQIKKALSGVDVYMEKAPGFTRAVDRATALAKEGWRVLLSPACASFDMFKDYEERGRVFKDYVRSLG